MTKMTRVTSCQVCGHDDLAVVFSAGYLPPVNVLHKIGDRLPEQEFFPAELLRCPKCTLVQLSTILPPEVNFPPGYAYRSGTTNLLRDNFADLAREVRAVFPGLLSVGRGVLDIGANDGSLLENFKIGSTIMGIEPTDAAEDCRKKGIPVLKEYFPACALRVKTWFSGGWNLITACNVFAHTDDPNEFVHFVKELLGEKGVFVVEIHYLPEMLESYQYDVVYHEHTRHYSLTSLTNLLDRHGMEAIRAKDIPTHGGSLRVCAARKGDYPVDGTVDNFLTREFVDGEKRDRWAEFRLGALRSKANLIDVLWEELAYSRKVYGVGAPSRATTLLNYCGVDYPLLEAVLEVPGSPKVGHYVPGTKIPIVGEDSVDLSEAKTLLILSWHLADSLIPKLRGKGFKGKFITPLPSVKEVG